MLFYSLKKLAEAIEFDVEDYIPLIQLFLETTDESLVEISAAVKSADKDIISSNIHNIKGASMNLGLVPFTNIMEEMSKFNKMGLFSDIDKRVLECKTELNKVKQVLEKS